MYGGPIPVIDRYGSPIRIGWSDHQILWIRAAMTLEGQERREAIQNIAELVGRPYASVWGKVRALKEQDRYDEKRRRLAETSRSWLAANVAAE